MESQLGQITFEKIDHEIIFTVILPLLLIQRGSCQLHYENTPIQIYRKFHLQKLKIFR